MSSKKNNKENNSSDYDYSKHTIKDLGCYLVSPAGWLLVVIILLLI